MQLRFLFKRLYDPSLPRKARKDAALVKYLWECLLTRTSVYKLPASFLLVSLSSRRDPLVCHLCKLEPTSLRIYDRLPVESMAHSSAASKQKLLIRSDFVEIRIKKWPGNHSIALRATNRCLPSLSLSYSKEKKRREKEKKQN